jgi:hypothetical protein
LKTQLESTPAVDDRHILQLTQELNSDLFPVREKATKELEKLGELAEPRLRKLMTEPATLEVRQRAKGLLDRLTQSVVPPEKRQAIRAVEALEYMATPQARELLQQLAGGAPGARLTREAAGSLKRLAER